MSVDLIAKVVKSGARSHPPADGQPGADPVEPHARPEHAGPGRKHQSLRRPASRIASPLMDQTTNAGDCAATVQLARVADAEAQVAAANIAGRHNNRDPHATMDTSAVPAVLFTYPQYRMVGATEQALVEDGVAYEKSFGRELSWPTYRRVGMKSAAYKILAGDDGTVLGAHILSDNATGLISIFTLAMRNHIPVDKLVHQCVMTPYPSRESDIIYMLRPLVA